MNAIACCANTTFVIDDKGYLRASGKNDFQQINELSKEYNYFIKLDLCQFVSASSSSVCLIDWNNTLTVKGVYKTSKPIPNVKYAVTDDKMLVYIDNDDTLHYVAETDIDTGLKASHITIFKSIFYTDLDNNLFEIDSNTKKPISADVKAKQIFSTSNNFAYIDMNDYAFVDGVNTKIKAKKIQFGFNFTVILSPTNELYFKGTNNYNQFGDLPDTKEFIKTNIIATDVVCGTYHVAYIDVNGKLHTKGYNYSGQLGTSFPSNSNDTDITVIDNNFVLPEIDTNTVKKDPSSLDIISNDVKKLESNFGNISNSIKNLKSNFDNISNISNSIKKLEFKLEKLESNLVNILLNKKQKKIISVGKDFAALIDEQNNLYLKGKNTYGQLDKDLEYFTKQNIKAKDVSCGFGHILLIDMNDILHVRGMNYYGQLGINNTEHQKQFVNTGIVVKYIKAKNWTSFIVKEDGLTYEAGINVPENNFILSEFYENA